MSLPIEYKRLNLFTGEKTKRQRQYKAQLITVHSGIILIRLGKAQISLTKNHSAWLPHECLYSIECTDSCQLDVLFLSARVTAQLPHSCFKLPASTFLNALIDEIADTPACQRPTESHHLLQVCLDQLHKLTFNTL